MKGSLSFLSALLARVITGAIEYNRPLGVMLRMPLAGNELLRAGSNYPN
jgi:hypothetical protein